MAYCFACHIVKYESFFLEIAAKERNSLKSLFSRHVQRKPRLVGARRELRSWTRFSTSSQAERLPRCRWHDDGEDGYGDDGDRIVQWSHNILEAQRTPNQEFIDSAVTEASHSFGVSARACWWHWLNRVDQLCDDGDYDSNDVVSCPTRLSF